MVGQLRPIFTWRGLQLLSGVTARAPTATPPTVRGARFDDTKAVVDPLEKVCLLRARGYG